VARILVYYKRARHYLPHIQEGLSAIAEKRFPESCRADAKAWTAFLFGGIPKDVCLTPYLIVRGVFSEAGLVIRRSLEHVGVLTHFWSDPPKAIYLADQDSQEFDNAFFRETNAQKAKELRDRGIRKRFVACSMAKPVSDLYKILSFSDVHGGTPMNVILSIADENSVSCGFIDRSDPGDKNTLKLLHNGIEMLCVEVSTLHGVYGKPYGVTPPMVGEGGRLLSALLSPVDSPSSEMLRELAAVQRDLGVNLRAIV